MSHGHPGFSPESAQCWLALGSHIVGSSRTCGWTSVLLDHHRVEPTFDAFETRPTPDQTIVVMLSGTQVIEVFGGGGWRVAPYRAGTIGMTPGGMVDRLRRRRQRGQSAFEKANLYVPQVLFQEAFEDLRRAGQSDFRRPLEALAFQDPLVVQTVLSLLRGMQAGLPDIYAQTAACWLATHLLSVHGGWTVDAGGVRPTAVSRRRIDAACEMIRARFTDPLTLDALAAEAGISKFHFARLFRQHTGTTPHAYIVQVRLQVARHLLTGTDLQIKQVAAQTGFSSVATLDAAFAREQGVTPSAYRHLVSR